jgi:predicted RNA-binding protein with PIN domain
MGRLYVIDAYNFVLQDGWLDRVVAEQGLEAARRSFRIEAESLARRAGCRIRLIYDGARGPFDHVDQFENQFVEVSFTSSGEKADERVVAVALEMVRRGIMIWVVSDDEAGVRQPLRGTAVTLLGTRDFAKLMRPVPGGEMTERRGEALSRPDQAELARGFLARDAARQPGPDVEDDAWAEIPRVDHPPAPASVRVVSKPGHSSPKSAVRAAASSPPPPAPVRPTPGRSPASRAIELAEQRKVKKERGARKQERRLSLLKSTAKSSPSKKPKR